MSDKRQYAEFSETLWKHITEPIEERLKHPGPHYAAFDADGTLWDIDVGESFFQFQQDNNLVPLPEDPWAHYWQLKKKHPPSGYLWLAQTSSAMPEADMKAHCRAHADSLPSIPIFPAQKKLIEWLHQRDVQVFVVTASIKWPVAALASMHFGISESRVLGVEVEIIDGRLTDKQKGAITWREGKREKLLDHTEGVRPLFSCGNTSGDLHLIECASQTRLAVSSTVQPGALFDSEQELKQVALKNNWPYHVF